jgi:hypothetical protein
MVAGVGAVMTGAWWIIGRRMKLAEEAARAKRQAKMADEQASQEEREE